MLSVIIRTHNGENLLLDVLRPLVAAAAEGVVRDVVFLDVGSTDGTPDIADAAGATLMPTQGYGAQATQEGLVAAHRAGWMLLLDQTTVLSAGWLDETISFVERQERAKSARGRLSAVFRPEHEPETGSADVRRRLAVLFANRLLSKAKLSQGILVRRSDLQGSAGQIDWRRADPMVRLPNLLRLRSRTHLAQPMEPQEKALEAERSQSQLSGAAL